MSIVSQLSMSGKLEVKQAGYGGGAISIPNAGDNGTGYGAIYLESDRGGISFSYGNGGSAVEMTTGTQNRQFKGT